MQPQINNPIPENQKEELYRVQRRDIVHGIIILIGIIALLFIIGSFLDFGDIRKYIEDLGYIGPTVLIILKASTIVFAPLIGTPIYLIAGPLFGFWKGFLYVLLGDIIGTAIAFWLSKLYGKKIIRFFFSDKLINLMEKMLVKIEDWKGLLYSRLILFAFHDLLSYAAGLTKIKFSTFMIVSIGSFIIPIALSVALGLAVIEKNIFTTAIIILLTIGIFGVIYEVLRRKKLK